MKKQAIIILIICFCIGFLIGIGIAFYSKKDNKIETQSKSEIQSVINNVNITDIPEKFSVEDAKEQGCFVITNNALYNKDVLDRFIKNTGINSQNRVEDKIRIVAFKDEASLSPIIYDLEYKTLDEKYINSNNKEVNKTGYILVTDPSRDESSETEMSYQESIEFHKIKVNDDIPGEVYGIVLKEYKDLNHVSIVLAVYPEILYTKDAKIYEDIDIVGYSYEFEKNN